MNPAPKALAGLDLERQAADRALMRCSDWIGFLAPGPRASREPLPAAVVWSVRRHGVLGWWSALCSASCHFSAVRARPGTLPGGLPCRLPASTGAGCGRIGNGVDLYGPTLSVRSSSDRARHLLPTSATGGLQCEAHTAQNKNDQPGMTRTSVAGTEPLISTNASRSKLVAKQYTAHSPIRSDEYRPMSSVG